MIPQEAVKEMLSYIVAECDEINVDQVYDDMLDECYPLDKVGGPFKYMLPSRVLEENDPVAYRCGKVDWLDSMRDEYVEVDDRYYNKGDVDKAQGTWIEDHLADAINELEDEIECEGEDLEAGDLAELKEKLANLEACLKACERHAF